MTEPTSDAAAIKAIEKLLAYYNFQDEVQTREQLLDRWLRSYPLSWVRLALIEALYQGRYKGASVEYLLKLWRRRGQPLHHFSRDFERLVSHNCPKTFLSLLQMPAPRQAKSNADQFLSSFMDEILLSSSTEDSATERATARDRLTEEDGTDTSSATKSLATEAYPPHVVAGFEDESVTFSTEASPSEQTNHRVSTITPSETSTTVSVRANSTAANPIHRFTPISSRSELFTKLAAMANKAD